MPEDETPETPPTPESPESPEPPATPPEAGGTAGAPDATSPPPSVEVGTPADQVPPAPAAPPRRKKGTGCLVALLVVVALIVGGGWFGWMWVQDKAEDAGVSLGRSGGIIPGFGGNLDECLRFQTSLTFLLTSSVFSMGDDEIESQLGELRDMAPEAVRKDVQVIGDALAEAMEEGLAGVTLGGGDGPTPEEQQANQEKIEEIFESPEVLAAQENINAWAEEHCTVDQDTPAP